MRHANLPLQVLASSVAFAPQSSTTRFLWRGISAFAAARVVPLVHSPWHLLCTRSVVTPPPAATGAYLGFVHVLFLSICSRCGRGRASRTASAPVVTPWTRGEIRPYYNRNSPMTRDESARGAIEMAAERPTGALLGVCTHVRLSSFAWRRQGMLPRMLQRHQRRATDIREHHRSIRDELRAHNSHSTSGSNRQSSVIRLARFANSQAGAIGYLHV